MQEKPFAPRDVFHLRGLGSGIEGYSVVRFASETLGLGLAAQRHAAAFFGEGLAKRLVAFTKQTLNADARALRKRIGRPGATVVGARHAVVDVEVTSGPRILPDEAVPEQRVRPRRSRAGSGCARKIQYFKRAQAGRHDALNTDYVRLPDAAGPDVGGGDRGEAAHG
jgi:hypothetical protein